jgi:hypothetical protein
MHLCAVEVHVSYCQVTPSGASKSTTSGTLHWRSEPELRGVQVLGVLVDGGSSLGAAVAFHMVELKRIDTEVTSDAFERDAVVDLFRCVITHILNCSPSGGNLFGQKVLAFR